MTREILLHNLNIDNPRQLPYRLDAVAILHQLNGVEYIKDLGYQAGILGNSIAEMKAS